MHYHSPMNPQAPAEAPPAADVHNLLTWCQLMGMAWHGWPIVNSVVIASNFGGRSETTVSSCVRKFHAESGGLLTPQTTRLEPSGYAWTVQLHDLDCIGSLL